MNYVIIGASAAGISACNILRSEDPSSSITLISQDSDIYSRCMLHLKLMGERDMAGISFTADDFISSHNINWLKGKTVSDISLDSNSVLLSSGESISYDKLLISSGASSLVPPIPNLRSSKNVFTFRDMSDVKGLESLFLKDKEVVVIGAGLVGMDATVGLVGLGANVTLVEMSDRILSIQLDDYSAMRYQERLESLGVKVITGIKTKEAVKDSSENITGIILDDDRVLGCDYCLVAAGVSPNISFIKDSRLSLTPNGRAISIDRHCRTNIPNIYAAGDVTFLAPIWVEAVRQGEVAAYNMSGIEKSLPAQDWSWTNSMNFLGLPTISYGRTSVKSPDYRQDIYQSPSSYKKIIHKDGVIYGAIFQGDINNCGIYLKLIKEGVNISQIKKSIFSLNYGDFFHQTATGEFS